MCTRLFAAIALVIVPLATTSPRAATERPTLRWTHTRPLSAVARHVVAEGAAASPSLRALLDELEGTNVVVYVSTPMSGFNEDFHGALTFVTSVAGTRYLHASVDLWTTPDDRIVLLGHELRHAIEVAATPPWSAGTASRRSTPQSAGHREPADSRRRSPRT